MRFGETDVHQFTVDRRQVVFVHPAEHEVLRRRGADASAGVLAGDLGQGMHLVRVRVANRQQHVDRAPAVILLAHDVRAAPNVEAFARGGAAVARRPRAIDGRLLEQTDVRLAVLLVEGRRQRRKLGLVQPLELFDAKFRDEKLDARLVLVAALAEAIPNADARLDRPELLIDGDELLEQVGDAWRRAESAADAHAEALLAVALHGHQADVVDGNEAAVLGTRRVGDLELAR